MREKDARKNVRKNENYFWGVTNFACFKMTKFLGFFRFLHQNNAILCHHRTLCIIKMRKLRDLCEAVRYLSVNMIKTAKSQPGKIMYSL